MKKKLFSTLVIFGAFAFTIAQTISFDQTTFDYGTIKTGSDGQRVFKVTNTGDKPLIINNVKPSCGCTTPVWSKDPVMPGKSTEIKVGYNTNLNGSFQKMIEVFSNDPETNRTVLYIKGNIDPNAAVAEVAKVQPASAPVKDNKVMSDKSKKKAKKKS